MSIDKKSSYIIGIMILAFWLSFLFMDALFSQNQKIPLPSSPMMQTASVASETPDTIADQLSITDVSLVQGHQAAAATGVALGEELPSVDIAKSQSLVEDIRALEFLYNKNPDTKILTSLIQRLATNYQFADANRYLKLLMKQPGYEKLLDVNVILYVLFHADDITVDTSASIQKLLTLIEQYRSTGLLSKNDYHFYRGLLLVRSQKYTEASQRRSSLSMDSRYGSLVQSYEKALAEFSGTQHVPAYYQDALVSVSMLKNGYFSVAKKLALSAVMKNTDYILPYQVLAYANFLSSNRDVSAEYFLKLADFDTQNSSRYIFLVGVSYYRQGKYAKSVLYLNQVTDPALATDTYRYQLLSYLAVEEYDGAVRIRQKLLGQGDVQASDFMQFFTAFFYQPYVNGQPFTLYRENAQLAALYLDACTRLGSGSQDVCLYGEVGQTLSTSTWAGIADKLVYLSNTYHQSSLLHVLGDYYFGNKEYRLAKDAYTQALSSVASSNEEVLLKSKLQKTLDAQ